MPLDVEQVRTTAKRMFKRYGASLAMEYAYGYATGAYFEQHQRGRKFWFAVWDRIQELYEESK